MSFHVDRMHGSVWYPKEVAAPASPCSGEPTAGESRLALLHLLLLCNGLSPRHGLF